MKEIRVKLPEACDIKPPPLGRAHDSLGHSSTQRRKDRAIRTALLTSQEHCSGAKHLIHAMPDEHNLVRAEVMKHPVIILVHAIAVPVTQHHFHGHERNESV